MKLHYRGIYSQVCVYYVFMRMCMYLEKIWDVVHSMCMTKHSSQLLIHLHHSFSLPFTYLCKRFCRSHWILFPFFGIILQQTQKSSNYIWSMEGSEKYCSEYLSGSNRSSQSWHYFANIETTKNAQHVHKYEKTQKGFMNFETLKILTLKEPQITNK